MSRGSACRRDRGRSLLRAGRGVGQPSYRALAGTHHFLGDSESGEKVGLPVDSAAFIEHVRTLLIETAAQADETYHDNPSFKMIDGLATLSMRPMWRIYRQHATRTSIPTGSIDST